MSGIDPEGGDPMRVLSVLVLIILGVVAVAMLARGEWGFAVISLLLCGLVGGQPLLRKRGAAPPSEPPPEV
jgi:hypothetical protein